ncbi:hypothetical protein NDU88_000135 [Pleurodeles waltl]|uniref:CCHC-type domain-containing protein n=1 Tax=Pleurodeles waltl TaxID=8319 RepID=A0AAV7N739_PLEWA|nr:hypothetical protein NDU88_000135 [Pleurodeles waltl]
MKGKPPTPVRQGPRCMYCGQEQHPARDCTVKGKQCSECGKLNHFATVCCSGPRGRGACGRGLRTSTVRYLSLEDPEHFAPDHQERKWNNAYGYSSPEEEEVFLVTFTNDLKKCQRPQPTCVIDVAGSQVKVPIDTGASVNVMSTQ